MAKDGSGHLVLYTSVDRDDLEGSAKAFVSGPPTSSSRTSARSRRRQPTTSSEGRDISPATTGDRQPLFGRLRRVEPHRRARGHLRRALHEGRSVRHELPDDSDRDPAGAARSEQRHGPCQRSARHPRLLAVRGSGQLLGDDGDPSSVDISVIDVTNPALHLRPAVTDWTTPNDLSLSTTPVRAVGSARVNVAASKSGRTTGNTSGVVTSVEGGPGERQVGLRFRRRGVGTYRKRRRFGWSGVPGDDRCGPDFGHQRQRDIPVGRRPAGGTGADRRIHRRPRDRRSRDDETGWRGNGHRGRHHLGNGGGGHDRHGDAGGRTAVQSPRGSGGNVELPPRRCARGLPLLAARVERLRHLDHGRYDRERHRRRAGDRLACRRLPCRPARLVDRRHGHSGASSRSAATPPDDATVAADGTWSIPSALGAGRYSITAVQTRSGASSPAATSTFTVSPPAPTISGITDGASFPVATAPSGFAGTGVAGPFSTRA